MRNLFEELDLLAQLDELSETCSPRDFSERVKYVALGLASLRAILTELWPFEDRGCTVASDANPGLPSWGARQVVLAVSKCSLRTPLLNPMLMQTLRLKVGISLRPPAKS